MAKHSDAQSRKPGDSRSPKGEARRAAIETEARQLLLREGYAAVSLRKIATRLGISLGNLQYYFPTRDDLVLAVIASETQKPLDMLEAVTWVPETPLPSIQKAVAALLHYYAGEAGRLYAITEHLALYDARYAALKAAGYAYVSGAVAQLVGMMAPDLALNRREALAQVLVALIDGASLQVQFGRDATDDAQLDVLIANVSAAIAQLLEVWE